MNSIHPKRHQLAFLHTSRVHVETFQTLVDELDPTLKVRHIVAEELLRDAQWLGVKDPGLVRRIQDAMLEAASTGAGLVVCTCSTIGGAAEQTPTGEAFRAARIDRAMADRAVALGPRILVAAALASTLGPTTDLIQESAAALQAEVEIEHLLINGAWAHFLAGDLEAYLREVTAAVTAAGSKSDVIVLAQASMAPAAKSLGDLGVEVLSSPLLGVHWAIAHLKSNPSSGRE